MNTQAKDIDEVVGQEKFIDTSLEKVMMLVATSNEVITHLFI